MEATTQNIAKIHQALDEIRPFLNNDGGDITFIELTTEGVVKVKLHGACIGCSVNQMTLKTGVEMTIKKYLPSITAVVQVQ
ncbi:MAG: NifU family protein [Schleiferiaceae bacterium]|nr:NifU family protein [Schleiferiaceae bacterium]